MQQNRMKSLLANLIRLREATSTYTGGDRCLVAPSPELRERIKEELESLRSSSSGLMSNLLRARRRTPIGMNDGLIYPGQIFPLGTSALTVSRAAAERAPLRGVVRVIVILVQFDDRAFSESVEHYEDLFFSNGVLPNGSVREYFAEVTHGLVDIVGEVVGPYTLPRTMTQYANGASGTGPIAPNARTMARDAAQAADVDVDFAPYDNDGDDFVDAFIVLHAGPGAESTGDNDHIWSHKWVLSGGAFDADGAKIYAYLTVPEEAKIGVCCHELGHLLFGFPDLYDTDYSSEGVGNWCLMGGGSWLGGGEIPAHPSAWCKLQQGWVTIEDPLQSPSLRIEDVKTGRKVYRLWKDAAPSQEYFLVENRQRAQFDRQLPGEGLLVWHIDDAVPSNTDEVHPKVALVQSDGRRDLENGNNRGDDGDPFPGALNVTAFGVGTTPSSNAYSGQESCVTVENISAPDAWMTADVVTTCAVDGLSWWEKLLRWLASLFGSS